MTAAAIPPTVTEPVRRRARLGRYALWQFGDFGVNVAIITLILFALLGVMFLMNQDAQIAYLASRKMKMPLEAKLQSFTMLLTMFTTVAPFIAMSGVFATDRSNGYTRFLFSKPMSPVRFYAQSVLVRLIGYLAVGCALMLVWSRYSPPGISLRFVADLTGAFFAIGGIIFLLSVVTRYDGLIAIVFVLVSAIAWDKWEQATGLRRAVTYLVPPIGKMKATHAWFLGLNDIGSLVDVPFPTKWFLWTSGYGLACLVLGLVLMRKVSLTKS
ncbi:MAG: hypothetical protein ABJF01_02000 [bacterium]